MRESAPNRSAPRRTRWWVWLIFFIIVGAIAWDLFDSRTYQLYLAKPRLSRVLSTLNPVKTALAAFLQQHGKLPEIATVVTADNQGKPATADWAALGFVTLPSLSPEVRSLRISAAGEIVVELTHLGKGMDGTELRARAEKETTGISWVHQCTSTDAVLKRQLHC